MPAAAPAFSLSSGAFAGVPADVLVAFVPEGAGADAQLDALTGGALASLLGGTELRRKAYETAWLPIVAGKAGKATRVLLVGTGKADDLTTERWRRVAIVAGIAVRQRRFGSLACLLPAGHDRPDVVQAVVEGVAFSAIDLDTYKTADRDTTPLAAAAIHVGASTTALSDAVKRGAVLGAATNEARLLANEPGNVLTPKIFAERAQALCADTSLEVRVLDEAAIKALGMGLVIGVAQGSIEPPRVLTLAHTPKGVTTGPILGLVGKGVTFDTGGISIKPAEMMDRMKDDMSGGAAVIAAMRALNQLNAPIRVVGVVAMVENMPGGKALKPGDVIRGASGKTVEVLNTDAEGRLILGTRSGMRARRWRW